jgi:ABC-2 type transport system ATP-binding protein
MLAIARALLPSPPVLLLDEPTRSLDPLAAADMRELISSLEGVSILLTSHNLSEIEELCARVAVISKGEIKTMDTPDRLRRTHTQVQSVRISTQNLTKADIADALKDLIPTHTTAHAHQTITVSFERQADDDMLTKAIGRLSERGAKVVDVETTMPTLLDVLESYE